MLKNKYCQSLSSSGAKTYEVNRWNENPTVHPYIGYVQTFNNENKNHVSDYGFFDTKSPIQNKASDKIIIGIFGGSVAWHVSEEGMEALEKTLRKTTFLSNKHFVFLNFSNGGYKQPQQLMILNYILALGGHLDLLINLDGFNEVALPAAENIPNNIFPFFPRSWPDIVGLMISDKKVLFMSKIINLETKKKTIEDFFSIPPLRHICTLHLIYDCLNQSLSSEISKERLELFEMRDSHSAYAAKGPSYHPHSQKEMYQDLANVWKNSSLQIHKICTANGIRYFHFLQPTQYLPHSKTMGKEELQIAILEGMPYQKPVEEGYPYLLKAGSELVKEGVNFFDLTQLFKKNNEIIYADNCCHVNKQGNEILGNAIGERISEFYSEKVPSLRQ